MDLTLSDVLELTGGKLLNEPAPEISISGVATLDGATTGEIAFLGNEKYFNDFIRTAGPKRIDLAVTFGIPAFRDVLEVVLEDMKIQKAIIASETKDVNPEMYAYFVEKIASLGAELVEVPHDELKALSKNSKCVIRTGECKPYSNIILESNVSF